MIVCRLTLSAPMSWCARAGRFRLVLGMLAACAFGLCLPAASALAAPPEAPLLRVRSLGPTSIYMRVALHPNAPGEVGTFELFYKQSATECQGANTVGPYYAGSAQGQEEGLDLEGFQEATQYTFCASLTTPGGTTLSAPLTLTMPSPEETPEALKAEPVGGRTATLHGVLNPLAARQSEPGSYQFIYRPSTSGECQGEGEIRTPSKAAAGAKEEAVSASLTELLPHTQYAFCVLAENDARQTSVSSPVTFTTLVAEPTVKEASVSDVAGTSATLEASVNPGGAATSYVFEYAPAGGSFVPVPGGEGEGSVGEGRTGVPVSAHVQGLLPVGAYAFRIVATNSAGTVTSEPVSFTTGVAGGGLMLPDERQWELVSPADKRGALIYGIGGSYGEGGVVQAAVGGDAVTFLASTPTEGEPPGYSLEEQVFSMRGPDGWVSRDISLPHERVVPASIGEGQEYRMFSEDLSLAVVQPQGAFEPLLSQEASEQTPYLRTNFLNGNVNEPCTQSCYRPLVTGKPGYANVAPGTAAFGEEGKCPPQVICGPGFSGATPDLSHIALRSAVPLLGESGGENEGYEWSEGKLSRGSHLPELRVSTSEDGSWSYFVSGSVLAPGAVSGDCSEAGTGLILRACVTCM
jgi:hypothetical protein